MRHTIGTLATAKMRCFAAKRLTLDQSDFGRSPGSEAAIRERRRIVCQADQRSNAAQKLPRGCFGKGRI
jgi:hypothetical protein